MERTICIVGGGAAGVVAAISAARTLSSRKNLSEKVRIILLEANDCLGKKLSVTGNGKCNYLNEDQAITHFHGGDETWIGKVLSQISYEELLDFFKSIGIYPTERKGYLYPRSEQASSFVWALQYELKRLGIQILLEERLRKLETITKPSGQCFQITTRKGLQFLAHSVVLCTGGCAAPKTGSDGSGYYYAKLFGHDTVETVPALCPLYLKADMQGMAKDYLKTWSGVRLKGCVRLLVDKQEKGVDTGEVMLTAYGISGIPTFQVSHLAARALKQQQSVTLLLDVFPEMSDTELREQFFTMSQMQPEKTTGQMLKTLLPEKFVQVISKKQWYATPFHTLSLFVQKDVIKQVKRCNFTVTGTGDFAAAQVSAGGVSTRDICETTMESTLQKGLFFAGELLDVHGDCGGYNLQWAWVTGLLAGKHAANQLCEDVLSESLRKGVDL